jgi:hypothetical protein
MDASKRKIMKSIKSTPQCDALCKVYLTNLNKKFSKRDPPYIPNKKANEENYQDCRRFHCNKTCKGALLFGTPKEQAIFHKSIKNGFHKNFTRKRVKELKKKGALSACTSTDYSFI